MSDLERVGTISWWPQESTEPCTNNGGYLGKCEVCGDTHWIGVVGQCAKG